MPNPFKAECSIKMLRIEYEGDDPAGALRAVGDTIGGMISAAAGAGTSGTPGTQRTFDHLRTEQRGPRASRPPAIVRELAHADARDAANRAAYSESEARQEALVQLRRLLAEYLRGIGERGTFQSAWFSRWLDETGQRPADLDLRCIGGIVGPLLTRGYIRTIGHQPDGGNPHAPGGGHKSATRPLFEIVALDKAVKSLP